MKLGHKATHVVAAELKTGLLARWGHNRSELVEVGPNETRDQLPPLGQELWIGACRNGRQVRGHSVFLEIAFEAAKPHPPDRGIRSAMARSAAWSRAATEGRRESSLRFRLSWNGAVL